MLKQQSKTGLLIYPENEIVTYVILHPGETVREAMKFVVNESTGWYCAGTRIDLLGTVLELQYDVFDKYKDLYLNDNQMTVCELLNAETCVKEKAMKIDELRFALNTLLEDGEELTDSRIFEEAKYVLSLFDEAGTSQNQMRNSASQHQRREAKKQIKALNDFIKWLC